jgi:hypothetical protein
MKWSLLRRLVRRYRREDRWRDELHDVPNEIKDIVARVLPYTMTGYMRVAALCNAIAYLARAGIAGPIVECGVWKGGSAMAAALMLQSLGDREREIHLFDTFDGMTPPDARDVEVAGGANAATQMAASDKLTSFVWAYAPLAEVQSNMRSTGFPESRVRYVQGPVEDTLPREAPATIALLRLDTDWYASTRHELDHLYPRLAVGGVLILDDYGHWQGAKDAVDEYVSEHRLRLLLNRVDYSCRIAVKIE